MTSHTPDEVWETTKALALQLQATNERVDQNEADLRDHVGRLLDVNENLHARVESVEETVAGLRGSWPTGMDAVGDWVDTWLIPTFELEDVLEDWRRRRSYVSELKAAHIGYLHIASSQAGPFDAMTWHSYLHSMIERIKGYHANVMTTIPGLGSLHDDELPGLPSLPEPDPAPEAS